MIINFSIKNFRSIREKVTLSFEATGDKHLEEYYVVKPNKGLHILKVGIIYGANASGKSNILKALDFLRKIVLSPFETKNKEFALQPFKFSLETINQPTEFELEFFHEGTRYLYFIKLNRKAVLEEKLYFYAPKKALIYSRITDTGKQLTRIRFGSKFSVSKTQQEILEGNTLWNNTVLGGFQKTNIGLQELKNVVDWFEQKLTSVIYSRLAIDMITDEFLIQQKIPKQKLIELLRYADFGIDDIDIKKQEIDEEALVTLLQSGRYNKIVSKDNTFYVLQKLVLHKIHDNTFTLEFYEESDGTQRFFGLAGLLLKTLEADSIMIIDELESSLHPDLLKHFLLTFLVNSRQAQLIATTHHRELLMEKDILRHDVIWFTERKQDQSTELYSLADFDSSIIRKQNSIYNFYKAGRLGAVPNLGSYYLNLDYGTKKKKYATPKA